jgi:hypothetical protein
MIRTTRVAFFICLGIALTSPVTGWVVAAIAIPLTFSIGLGLLGMWLSLRHFAKDPLGELRENHNHVAARLREGVAIDRAALRLVDFCDFVDGGDFDA